MAGACTIAYDNEGQYIRTVVWTWTSSAGGAVSGFDTRLVSGVIERVVTNPGSAAPTDNYDITITDPDTFDVLNGLGVDRDTVNTESIVPILEQAVGANTYGRKIAVCSVLSLAIANAGAAKTGTITMYLSRGGTEE